jgi:hypothetical protein
MSSLQRLLGICAATIALLASSGSALAAHPHPDPCKTLRGKDLAPMRYVKLVRRETKDAITFVSCVTRERRFKLITMPPGSKLDVVQVRGDHAILSADSRDGHGGGLHLTVLASLGSGQVTSLGSTCWDATRSGPCDPVRNTVALATRLDSHGEAIAAVTLVGPTTLAPSFIPPSPLTPDAMVLIEAFPRDNEVPPIILDAGPADQLPPSSLSLDHTDASWLHFGTSRSADIADLLD